MKSNVENPDSTGDDDDVFETLGSLRRFLEIDLGFKPGDYALVVLDADEAGSHPLPIGYRSAFEHYHCASCGGLLTGTARVLAEAGFGNTVGQPLCAPCTEAVSNLLSPALVS